MASEGYHGAAVCRRGHKITALIEPAQGRSEPIPERCSQCGAKVLTACPSCSGRIKGYPRGSMVIGGPEWQAADFCDRCGSPFPWASRESIALHIENLLDEQPDLADGDRRVLEEQLKALRDAPSDAATEKRQLAALKALQKLAPKAWELAAPVLQAFLSAEMKRAAGLPPTP
jgi:hypothetical protein